MKCIRIAFVVLVFIFTLSPSVYAEGYEDTVDKIYSLLPEESKEVFIANNLEPNNGEWLENLDTSGFFSMLRSFFKEGLSSPLSAVAKSLSVLLLSALMLSYSSDGKIGATVDSVSSISVALILALPIYEIIAAAKEAISGVSVFTSGAVPVFAAVKAASGKPLSASFSSATVLLACQALSYFCGFILVPFMNGYLALGICSAFGGKSAASGIMEGIKKIAVWVLSFLVTVFLFILSAKGIAAKGTDTLTMKTAKFVLGTAVPVLGGALSESASGVAASLSAISNTAGIYVIVAVLIITLPLLVQIVCWRLALIAVKYLSVLFSVSAVNSLACALENVISLLFGVTLLSLFLLIISSGVLISL